MDAKLKTRNKGPVETVAQVISDVVSPLLVPTYCTCIALWLTPLKYLPDNNRLIASLIIAVITCVVPLATIALLIKLGMVSDRSISDRTQRTVPFTVATVCYLAAAMFLWGVGAPIWLKMFFIGAAFSTAAAMLINFKWKISAHTTAVGGMAGFATWLAVTGWIAADAPVCLTVVYLATGLVGTSRLILGRHTPWQVAAGTALGAAVAYGCMMVCQA